MAADFPSRPRQHWHHGASRPKLLAEVGSEVEPGLPGELPLDQPLGYELRHLRVARPRLKRLKDLNLIHVIEMY